ncbi:MAG: aminoacyl-tRNA hydrolase [Oscillospiraceae bacterium]|nr:aminoacyl-tRNA hydrolase [Oscillospiraceae bacterium]MCL2278792.1 aminoacyl-tRNA hydrolase [Oscillospiraceae bacterium]
MFFRRNNDPVEWIAVFLGNPGLRYDNTRHNAGFMVADIIAKEAAVKIIRAKFSALTGTVTLGGKRVLLVKPQTYMNLSGTSVRQAMKFHRVPLQNILVISDEVSLPPGKLRIRRRGSSGGHNGLRDIISKCGGEDFPRIRLGVGSPPHDDYAMADWVLSKLTDEETKQISDAALRAAAALEMTMMQGLESAMTKYN